MNKRRGHYHIKHRLGSPTNLSARLLIPLGSLAVRREGILDAERGQGGTAVLEENLARVGIPEVRVAEDAGVVVEPRDGLLEEGALLVDGAVGLELRGGLLASLSRGRTCFPWTRDVPR